MFMKKAETILMHTIEMRTADTMKRQEEVSVKGFREEGGRILEYGRTRDFWP